ncbi:hypothetical protein MUK42_34066 [Musa troglodytarum]|uniref:Uncharacterized protein n=1 Tax=Musa troglodytarum TaxID=320322 RepID=A0A9E7HQR4_9LILI|nr:hypothetical protein MUK42_34066 [Musa troglodytarum]
MVSSLVSPKEKEETWSKGGVGRVVEGADIGDEVEQDPQLAEVNFLLLTQVSKLSNSTVDNLKCDFSLRKTPLSRH